MPVMVTGGIGEPDLADRAVREGWADLVGVGRAMLNDPDWAAKAIAHLSSRRRCRRVDPSYAIHGLSPSDTTASPD